MSVPKLYCLLPAKRLDGEDQRKASILFLNVMMKLLIILVYSLKMRRGKSQLSLCFFEWIGEQGWSLPMWREVSSGGVPYFCSQTSWGHERVRNG